MLNSCLIRAHHTFIHNKHVPLRPCHLLLLWQSTNLIHLISLPPLQAGTGGSARRPTTVPGAVLVPCPVPLGPTPTSVVRPAAPAARLVTSVPRRRGTSPRSRAHPGTTALTVTRRPTAHSRTTGRWKALEKLLLLKVYSHCPQLA